MLTIYNPPFHLCTFHDWQRTSLFFLRGSGGRANSDIIVQKILKTLKCFTNGETDNNIISRIQLLRSL